MKTKTIIMPALEPVTLAQVKDFLKLSNGHEDDTLQLMLVSARELVEEYIHQRLIQQTVSTSVQLNPHKNTTSTYRIIPGGIAIKLPQGPISRITQVQVTNDRSTITLDPAKVSRAEGSNLVVLMTPWVKSAQITYEVGYGETADAVPAPLRQAILVLTAQLYENRAKDPDAHTMLRAMLAPYCVRGVQ